MLKLCLGLILSLFLHDVNSKLHLVISLFQLSFLCLFLSLQSPFIICLHLFILELQSRGFRSMRIGQTIDFLILMSDHLINLSLVLILNKVYSFFILLLQVIKSFFKVLLNHFFFLSVLLTCHL
jgi:hypothetical protein